MTAIRKTDNQATYQEICISSDSGEYHFRLVGYRTGNGIIKQGTLETCTVSDGKSLGDWKKVGTFTEGEEENSTEDFETRLLELSEKNMKFEIHKCYNYTGYIINAMGFKKTRSHWYERWRTIPLTNLTISEN
jgi:hypothetical protein